MQASSRNTSSSTTKNCGPGHQPQLRGRTGPTRPQELRGDPGEGASQETGPVPVGGALPGTRVGVRVHVRPSGPPPPGLLPHWTHGEQKASVLLDGPDAAHEADGHHEGASDDEQVGGRQRWEGGGQGGEVALCGCQPDAHAKDAAAAQLGRDAEGDTVRSPPGAHCLPSLPPMPGLPTHPWPHTSPKRGRPEPTPARSLARSPGHCGFY